MQIRRRHHAGHPQGRQSLRGAHEPGARARRLLAAQRLRLQLPL